MTKSEDNQKGNSALLIAIIGGFITACGYIGTYYKDLVIQQKT